MPHSFEFADFAIDGNKANQTSGDGVGIRVYGKRYFVKNVFIYNTRGVGFYSEAGAAGGQSEPYDMPETIISGLYVYSSGSYGIHYRGPHDGYIESAFVSNAGNNGIQLEESAMRQSLRRIYSQNQTPEEGLLRQKALRAVFLEPIKIMIRHYI
jgi:hypothetical protein